MTDFSPDGAWLAAVFYRGWGRVGNAFLLNLAHEDVSHRFYFRRPWPGWSSEGQWLFRQERQALVLMAPAYDYEQIILYEPGCYGARWHH